MTWIAVHAPEGRITGTQRSELARTLTDAVLEVEVGQLFEPARLGFQVHFHELPEDRMAFGGTLLSEQPVDALVVDVAVMDGAWPADLRATVIENLLVALAKALGTGEPSPNWWVNFRVIDEGSWGAGGRALSIHALLDAFFTPERAKAIREAIPKR